MEISVHKVRRLIEFLNKPDEVTGMTNSDFQDGALLGFLRLEQRNGDLFVYPKFAPVKDDK